MVTKSWTRLKAFTFTFHFHALEKEMATYSSVLAWRIPGMEEPGGLPSMGSQRVRHSFSSWSPLSPSSLFSSPCTSLVSLTVEKLFIINLDVLSSVLYRWRSLEATVRIRLKTRGRKLKSKS